MDWPVRGGFAPPAAPQDMWTRMRGEGKGA